MSWSNDVVHDQMIGYWLANGQLDEGALAGWEDTGPEAFSDLTNQAAGWDHTSGPGLITEG